MSYDDYWNGNVWAVEHYREAEKIRQERENQGFWLQGMYIHEGFSIALANALSKKGTPPKAYPAEPYPLFRKGRTEEEKSRDEETERLKAKLYMQNMVRAGRSWGK